MAIRPVSPAVVPVLGRAASTRTIVLTAGVSSLLFQANDEKIILIANIGNPSNAPLFLGLNTSARTNGFPILQGERMIVRVLPRTTIYGYSTANLVVYLMITGING